MMRQLEVEKKKKQLEIKCYLKHKHLESNAGLLGRYHKTFSATAIMLLMRKIF